MSGITSSDYLCSGTCKKGPDNTWNIVQVPSPQQTNWISIFSGLLTPIIAIIAVIIATRQWITSRNKLKLDLFEKRYAVFEATKKVLFQSMRTGKPTDEDLYPFLSATSGSRWLFNQEIENYLQVDLWAKLTEFQMLNEELEHPGEQASRAEIVKKRGVLRTEINAQLKILEKKFAPFLQLSH